jgi:hypothetical protein
MPRDQHSCKDRWLRIGNGIRRPVSLDSGYHKMNGSSKPLWLLHKKSLLVIRTLHENRKKYNKTALASQEVSTPALQNHSFRSCSALYFDLLTGLYRRNTERSAATFQRLLPRVRRSPSDVLLQGLLVSFPAKAGIVPLRHIPFRPQLAGLSVLPDRLGTTADSQGIAEIGACFCIIEPNHDGFTVVLNCFPRLPEACKFDGEAVIHEGA